MFVNIGVGQSKKKENKIEQNNNTEIVNRENYSLEPQEFHLNETSFNINGISLIYRFNLEAYIEKIGKPDKIERGGQKIIDEFGYDDYSLFYSKNNLVAGHGQLLSAYIFEPGISFNGIEIGNDRDKVEKTFNINTMNENSIKIVSRNDHVLSVEFDENGKIFEMSFYSPI